MPSLVELMIRPAPVLAFGLVSAVAFVTLGQDTPVAPAVPAPAEKPDEITVSRQKPAQLRAEIEKAEDALYELFNSLNSTDEFDIHCRRVVPTGRRVPERVCLPNYMGSESSQAGKSVTREAQGAASPGNSQESAAITTAKRRQLEAEIQKLGRENGEFGAALVRLATAQQALQASQKK